ncbi:MAG: metallophosphoesterase [Culicoidibacterales bacterium]
MIKHFEINKKGRDFVVGDIHGFFTKLKKQLDEMGFDYENDRLFSVGDLVDRGPESHLALDWLSYSWFHPVRGNHEELTIEFCNEIEKYHHEWLHVRNGGKWYIETECNVQEYFKDAFLKLPICIDVMTNNGLVGIVHADIHGNNWFDFLRKIHDKNTAAIMYALWNRERFNDGIAFNIEDLHKLYVGHTPVEGITVLGNVEYIDTHSYNRDVFDIIEL